MLSEPTDANQALSEAPTIELVEADSADLGNPGIIAELGQLGSGAVISEEGMSRLFGRHPTSVKRAIERGEIPHPFRLFGRNTWTAGALVRHFDRLLEDAAREAEVVKAKIRQLSP